MPLEHLLEAVIVADRGERRGVGGQRDRCKWGAVGGEAADELRGDVLGVGRAAAVAGQQNLAAAAQRAHDPLGDGDDHRHELRISGDAFDRLARAAQIFGDSVRARIGHGGLLHWW